MQPPTTVTVIAGQEDWLENAKQDLNEGEVTKKGIVLWAAYRA